MSDDLKAAMFACANTAEELMLIARRQARKGKYDPKEWGEACKVLADAIEGVIVARIQEDWNDPAAKTD